MAGILRLSNTGTGNGQSTITTAATGDATYTLPSFGGTLLTSSGNVTLPFASGTVSAPSVTFISDLDTGLYSPGANQVAIATSGTSRVLVDASGRVGIGSTPTARLDVRRQDADGLIAEFHQNSGYGIDIGSSESIAYISAGYLQSFVFKTDPSSGQTERMRIAQNGVVTVKNGAVAEIGTLADGATITPDLAANCNFTVTISGNRTLANPSNITAGQTGSIFIIQGTGSNTLSWGSYWDFPGGSAPTLTTTSGAVDRVDYVVRSSTSIHTVFTANYS